MRPQDPRACVAFAEWVQMGNKNIVLMISQSNMDDMDAQVGHAVHVHDPDAISSSVVHGIFLFL